MRSRQRIGRKERKKKLKAEKLLTKNIKKKKVTRKKQIFLFKKKPQTT